MTKAEMHTLDDRVGLGIFHCSGKVGDTHVLEELLEGLSRKFAAIVVDAADRARITIEPKRVKFCGDVGRRFVFQTACIAEAGEGIDTC